MSVRMTHPASGGEYDADPLQVPHLQASGWQVAPDQDERGDVWPVELQRFEGQPPVRLRHPQLEGEITVAESAVPFHREKGWLLIEDAVTQDLEGETAEQLRDRIRELNTTRPDDDQLPLSGTKPQLRERLQAAETQDQEQAGEEPAHDSEDES